MHTLYLVFLIDHLYNTFGFGFREGYFFHRWFTGLFGCFLLKLFLNKLKYYILFFGHLLKIRSALENANHYARFGSVLLKGS